MARVLVVDDEDFVRRLMARLLERTGHTPLLASTAQEALEAIRMHDPEVVFCDVHLKGESGLRLAGRIHGEEPLLPVVLISGDNSVPATETLKAGVIRYVLKPPNFAEIADAIEAALAWRRAEGDARRASSDRLLRGGAGGDEC